MIPQLLFAVVFVAAVVVVCAWVTVERNHAARPKRTLGCGRPAPRRSLRQSGCAVRVPREHASCRRDDDPASTHVHDDEERRARYEATQRRGKEFFRARHERLSYLSGASRREMDPERESLIHTAAIRQYAIDLPNHRHKDRYTRRVLEREALGA